MRARRVDENLGNLVAVARAIGLKVHVTNADWDATVQLGDKTELWEVKTPTGRPTKLQARMKEQGWRIRTVRTEADVLRAKAEMGGYG